MLRAWIQCRARMFCEVERLLAAVQHFFAWLSVHRPRPILAPFL